MVNIALTSSMKNNLLSLQSIASRQSLVQNRLATGLKVSSAIDNPASYYTAQSLNNRAGDLSSLLDTMSQGIQTLKAVSETISYATNFLEQAKAVANKALEKAQPIVARVSNEADLQAALASEKKGLIVIENDIIMATNSNIVLKDGQSLVGAKYLDSTAQKTSISFNFDGEAKAGIELMGNSTISDLDLNLVTNKKTSGNMESNREGFIAVSNSNTKNILNNLNISLDTSADTSEVIYVAVKGTDNTNTFEIYGNVNIKDAGIRANNNRIYGFADAKINLMDASTININTEGSKSLNFYRVEINTKASSTINILSKGTKSHSFFNTTANIEGSLNIKSYGSEAHAFYNSKMSFGKDSRTNIENKGGSATLFLISSLSWKSGAEISYSALAISGSYSATSDGAQAKSNVHDLGTIGWNKTAGFIGLGDNYFTNQLDKPNLPGSNKIINNNQKDYKNYTSILEKFDALIKDGSYKGINLLLEQNLKINFNEDRNSMLEIKGVNASTDGLGLSFKDWEGSFSIQSSINELDNAISTLRQYSTEFGNHYSVVSNREEFTKNIINVLTEGADKLTLADMNQESANMLALQTAQNLAVNSLSLASQAAQSVLKLF